MNEDECEAYKEQLNVIVNNLPNDSFPRNVQAIVNLLHDAEIYSPPEANQLNEEMEGNISMCQALFRLGNSFGQQFTDQINGNESLRQRLGTLFGGRGIKLYQMVNMLPSIYYYVFLNIN